MNTFYHFEDKIFETVEEVENATKNYANKMYDEIKTDKSFDEFDTEFYKLRGEGNSIDDAIEWAK